MLLAGAIPAVAQAPLSPEDYNQWKQALNAAATPVKHITAPRGFEVELLREARPEEGSWVSMAFDGKGRIIIARESRGLLRFTPGSDGPAELFATNLLECRGLLFAFDALYANANNSKGLYRLRDTDADDHFDEVQLLKETAGSVGHGRNDLVLGPDNYIYLAHGDDVGLPKDADGSMFPRFAPDRLLACEWEGNLYGAGVPWPGGHIIRTDRDGRTWQLIAGGLRNPFGLDFNADGELFTYDADLEWDIGLPWYHPTRVLHLVPGADYGWRRDAATLPTFPPDTRPAVTEIGKGSPTAVRFGRRSNFPAEYRDDCLFILDWAYGRILAVRLTPEGASYRGDVETFVQGKPLNLTDLEFGPDGALYFITGGRKTQSALYRVRYTGPFVTLASEPKKPGAALRKLRRSLEAHAVTLEHAWAHLDHSDSWIRYAARTALERQPVDLWQERALKGEKPEALLALARVGEAHARVLSALNQISFTGLNRDDRITILRTYAVSFIRVGKPEAKRASGIARRLAADYPDRDGSVNQQLCELLVYLEAEDVVAKTLPLLRQASTPPEKLFYLNALRLVRSGWTLPQRKAYFETLRDARSLPGAHYVPLVVQYIRRDAEKSLTENEKVMLKDLLSAEAPATAIIAPDPNRKFVKAWNLSDLEAVLASVNSSRDRQRGKRLFQSACASCHVYAGQGTPIGPELTSVAARFPRRDLLESILDPSKVVAELYRNITITTKNGMIREGRFIAEDDSSITLATNPTEPNERWRVRKTDLASRQISELSSMPTGLLDVFEREEILDLMAFLEFGE
ncbi:MAG TPA: c-type cytochrome [Verrucomicrobiae bacterium]|nr:c-type cytochrome [Verrucomicrobiae bacterium]